MPGPPRGNRRRDPSPKRPTKKPSAVPPKKPALVKKTPALKQTQPSGPPPLSTPLRESQQLLNLFSRTFADVSGDADLPQTLQTIKGHLFNRDYLSAFAKPLLPAYALRWSPSRALLYRAIFEEYVSSVFSAPSRPRTGETQDTEEVPIEMAKIVCIGGGAGGELAGAASCVASQEAVEGSQWKIHVTAVDIAEWDDVVGALVQSFKSDTNFGAGKRFDADFRKADILGPGVAEELITPDTKLVTLCFTTNELYTQSRADTTQFLLGLGERLQPGTLLLVVESAGSYSTVKVGEKVFDMGLLLEHTLLRAGEGKSNWEMTDKRDSQWFRLPEGIKFPLQLEDARVMVRVFRRTR